MMKEFFQKRLSSSIMNISRYGRYILNDHIKFVLLFVVAAGAYYYSEWLSTLQENWPFYAITACLMAVVVSFGKVVTFLERADEVYLLPLEKQMKEYFSKCVTYTFLGYLLPVLFITFVTIPFLMKGGFSGKSVIIGYLIITLFLKYTQLQFRLLELYTIPGLKGIFPKVVQYIVTAVIFYFYFTKAYIYCFIVLIIWLSVLLYFIKKKQSALFLWFEAIKLDEERWSRFYRFAQLFTDVPNLPVKVKRRQYCNIFYTKKGKTPFQLLYERAFIRGQDYAPMLVRLCLIGIFVIYLLPYQFTSLAVGSVVYYLIGYQMLPLFKSFDYVPWTNIYPFSLADKMKSFEKIFSRVTMIIWGVFVLASLIFQDGLTSKVMCIAGLTIVYAVLWFRYFSKRIKKMGN